MNIKNCLIRLFLNFTSLERHVILASYPKTGGTFLHYLISNLLIFKNNIQPEFSYTSTYINSPDLDMIPIYKINNVLDSYNKPALLLKTHKHYHTSFHRIICLVRDPIKTFISRYNYERTFLKKKYKNFKSFLLKTNAIDNYKRFYESYLNSELSTRIVFVNYEDIIQNEEVIKDMIFLIYGINLDIDYINQVSTQCSKYKAMEIEKLYQQYDKRNKILQRNFVNNKLFLKNVDDKDKKYITSNLDLFYKLLSNK